MSDEVRRRIEAYLQAVDTRPSAAEIAAAVRCSTSAVMRILSEMGEPQEADPHVADAPELPPCAGR
jgi:hypothetical protein